MVHDGVWLNPFSVIVFFSRPSFPGRRKCTCRRCRAWRAWLGRREWRGSARAREPRGLGRQKGRMVLGRLRGRMGLGSDLLRGLRVMRDCRRGWGPVRVWMWSRMGMRSSSVLEVVECIDSCEWYSNLHFFKFWNCICLCLWCFDKIYSTSRQFIATKIRIKNVGRELRTRMSLIDLYHTSYNSFVLFLAKTYPSRATSLIIWRRSAWHIRRTTGRPSWATSRTAAGTTASTTSTTTTILILRFTAVRAYQRGPDDVRKQKQHRAHNHYVQ